MDNKWSWLTKGLEFEKGFGFEKGIGFEKGRALPRPQPRPGVFLAVPRVVGENIWGVF